MFDAIATHQVTATLVVPTMIQLMVDHPEIGKYDLSSLRNVLYGASPISQGVLERAMKARACWAVQVPVGWAVTPRMCMRRV